LLAEHDLPGLAIGVCNASGALWTSGFGSTRAAGGEPITARTMFSVQSCSKMYTATAVMVAVQEGLVELDVPITAYLPEFTVHSRFEAAPERKITLRHLLSHTAAFTHEAPVGSNFLVGRASFEAHCQSISDTWLRFPVGHHHEYSNLGFDLAGYILHRASGLPFHELMRRALLEPLGLRRTTFDQKAISREPDRAVGHDRQRTRLPLRVPMLAAGGLYTSIDDACRFVQLHLARGESLLNPASVAEMHSIPFSRPDQELGYALGVASYRWSGVLVRGHGGGGFGFLSDAYWAPSADVGVVILTNSTDHPLQGKLAREVLLDLVGTAPEPARQLPAPVAASPEELRLIAGEYVGRSGSLTLVAEDSTLFLVGREKHAVRVVAPDQVALEEGPHDRFRLLPGERDRPKYLQRVQDGLVWYRNDAPEPAAAAALPADARWEGDYVLKASGVDLRRVRLRSDNGVMLLEVPGESSLRLEQYAPGLFFSSTGEALDLTRIPLTYANIPLVSRRERT